MGEYHTITSATIYTNILPSSPSYRTTNELFLSLLEKKRKHIFYSRCFFLTLQQSTKFSLLRADFVRFAFSSRIVSEMNPLWPTLCQLCNFFVSVPTLYSLRFPSSPPQQLYTLPENHLLIFLHTVSTSLPIFFLMMKQNSPII